MPFDELCVSQPSKQYLNRKSAPHDLNIDSDTEIGIRWYCFVISTGENDAVRSEMHKTVCSALGMQHHEFLPFEDESIKTIPNPEEAVEIFWKALRTKREGGSQ